MAAACLAIAVLMLSVAFHSHLMNNSGHWTTPEITNIVVLLVGICAGAATYVAQQHATDVVARLASGLRALGLVAICVPAATAIGIVYVDSSPVTGGRFWRDAGAIWLMAAVSVISAAIVILAWARVLTAELSVGHQSLWDMTAVSDAPAREEATLSGRARQAKLPGSLKGATHQAAGKPGNKMAARRPRVPFRSRPRTPQAPHRLAGASSTWRSATSGSTSPPSASTPPRDGTSATAGTGIGRGTRCPGSGWRVERRTNSRAGASATRRASRISTK